MDPDNLATGAELYHSCRREEAVAVFERAVAANPHSIAARLGLGVARLPLAYTDNTEIERTRAAYHADLLELHPMVAAADAASIVEAAEFIGSMWPFYLAAQGRYDRDLQALHGEIVANVMAARYPEWATAPVRQWTPGERIRVGFVSGCFRFHSTWRMPIRGWVENVDRSRFQLFAYSTHWHQDGHTGFAAGLFERFEQGSMPLERWVEAIDRDAPHVLIFPEVGVDKTATQLAALRLAPIQCSSWGCPVTSGLPTIDYYLSSDLMEPPDGEGHYVERLVRLPCLSAIYFPWYAIATSSDDPARLSPRESLRLPTDSVLFFCGQSTHKFLPDYDDVFPRIAAELPAARFAFIDFIPASTEILQRRLKGAFARHGLSATAYCMFVPFLSPEWFSAMTRESDVFLDTFSWSGCNTTLEAFDHSVPIVTLPGSLMRGRHSFAILTAAGVIETVARSVDDYVDIAVRLGRDTAWREHVRKRLAAGKLQVYGDLRPVRALEDFIERFVADRCQLRQSLPCSLIVPGVELLTFSRR